MTTPYPAMRDAYNQNFGTAAVPPTLRREEKGDTDIYQAAHEVLVQHRPAARRGCVITGVTSASTECFVTNRTSDLFAIDLALTDASLNQTTPSECVVVFAPVSLLWTAKSERSEAQFALKKDDPSRPELMHELRRLSGLTWEQLASLLAVSRRTVHNWANGLTMSRKHEERLARTLSVMHAIDRGSASDNRALLLMSTGDGETLLDLLGREEYQKVLAIAGDGGAASMRERRARRSFDLAGAQPAPPWILANSREVSQYERSIGEPRQVPKSRIRKREPK